ncbi:MAG TPA: hypothetical protein VND21_03780 [Planctomycetota bacterium]|nr:hypothetical protein [Planctomycetota bacterium]
MAKKRKVTERKRKGAGDHPKELRPGTTVGRRSPADDGVPVLEQRRGQTIRTATRGRRQPVGRPPTNLPNPPRRGRARPET